MSSAAKFVLLFGMPRSGTTWLGKIFDSHPLTLYKHEPDRRLKLPFAIALPEAAEMAGTIQDFFSRLAAINSPHVAARLPVFRKQYRSGPAQFFHRASVLVTTAAGAMNRNLPVFQGVNVSSPEVHVVWKSTDSLGRLGAILRVVENSRGVRILRHPCGYISSVLRGEAQRKFVAATPTSEDYGLLQILLEAAGPFRRGLSIDHMRQFSSVERMAWIWVLLNEKAWSDTANNARCTSVRYEDVCRYPEGKTRELFSFFGLSWTQQTSAFLRASTLTISGQGIDRITHKGDRYYSVFKDPIRAAEKWKSEMKADEIEQVYRVLRQSDLISLYPESELRSSDASAVSL